MKTTMDSAGRLVIPKELRREARLQPGAPLEVRWRDGRIEIEPAPLPVTLERRGKLTVAVAPRAMPPLTADDVERVRRQTRRERGGRE